MSKYNCYLTELLFDSTVILLSCYLTELLLDSTVSLSDPLVH